MGGVSNAQSKHSVIYLKDGSRVEGKIKNQTEEKITIEKKRHESLIAVSDVDKIVPWKKAPSVAPVNSVSWDVSSLIGNKLAFNYDRRMFSKKQSLGAGLTYEYPGNRVYTGFTISPRYRYYIWGEANSYGFYVQAKFSLGFYSLAQKNIDDRTVNNWISMGGFDLDTQLDSYDITKKSFLCYGGGVSLGYLFRIGDHWGIDMNAGLRIISSDKATIDYTYAETQFNNPTDGMDYDVVEKTETATVDELSGQWTGLRGAGFPLECRIGVSYRF